MGFFSYLLGTDTLTGKLSHTEHYLGKDEVFLLVSTAKVKSLNNRERDVIRELILKRSFGDGKISVYQIDEVLRQAEHEHLIGKYDRQGVVRAIDEYFKRQFLDI